MQALEKIQEEISALPFDDQVKLSRWFGLMDAKAWDQEIERDFQNDGRAHQLLEKIKKDFKEGKCARWD